MDSTDRNDWDPPTPPGNIESAASALAVDLYIYILVRSAWAFREKEIITHVKEASRIWCQSKINIQAVHIETVPTLRPSEPIDLSIDNLAGQIVCPFADDYAEHNLLRARETAEVPRSCDRRSPCRLSQRKDVKRAAWAKPQCLC